MQRLPLYVGVLLCSMATLMLEILVTRITSVVAWYHLAFFVISLGMLGMTFGAVLVYVRPAWFAEEQLERRLAESALGFAISTPVCIAWALAMPMIPVTSVMTFLGLLGVGTVLAVPFAWSGVTLTLALTRLGLPPGLVYGVDLCGAALGCVLVVPLLDHVDAPSAALLAGALAALAAFAFAGGAGAFRRRAAVAAAVLVALALVNASRVPQPLRPAWVKGLPEQASGFDVIAWNTYSRVTVDREITAPPLFWAKGRRTPDAVLGPRRQRWLRIDGAAGTGMTELGASAAGHDYLDWDISSFVQLIRREGPALVIGVGGGRDVLAAAHAGHAPVVGLELNEAIVALHRGRYARFSGLTRLPGVRLVSDEARSWLARDTAHYETITMSLIDTWASTGAGAYSLSENGLYTADAWRLFVRRLAPDGLFTVSRWYAPQAPGETARMLVLALATLFDEGAARPADHVVLVRRGIVATLLLSRTPLAPADLARIEEEASIRGFDLLYEPGRRPELPVFAELAAQPTRAALDAWARRQALDLTAPSDDRPFFFHMLKPGSWLDDPSAVDTLDLPYLGNLQASQTLVYATLVSLLLTLLTVGVPMALRRRELAALRTTDTLAACGYFALIGLGFMFVEMGLLSRLDVFLGHPILGLAVMLGGLIFFAGVGSLLSHRVPVERRAVAIAYPVLPAALVLATGAALVPVMRAFEGSPTPVRVAVSLALVAPPALALGLGFPLGLRLAERMQRARLGRASAQLLGPWLWGVNGAAGVCASGLALGCSMVWGIHATLAVGACCYAVLPALTAVLFRRGEAS